MKMRTDFLRIINQEKQQNTDHIGTKKGKQNKQQLTRVRIDCSVSNAPALKRKKQNKTKNQGKCQLCKMEEK